MLGRAVNLYFITKYKNISTRKPKYRRAVMRIKEFILYGLIDDSQRHYTSRKKLYLKPGYSSNKALNGQRQCQ